MHYPEMCNSKNKSLIISAFKDMDRCLPGFSGNCNSTYFKADKVLSLAAPKSLLFDLPFNTEIWNRSASLR